MAGDWGGGEPEKTIWRERCRPCDKKIVGIITGAEPHPVVAKVLPFTFSLLSSLTICWVERALWGCLPWVIW